MDNPNQNNQTPNPYQSQSQDPQPYNPYNPQPNQHFAHRPTCGLAITSMVLGIIGILSCYFGLLFGGIGVIFGHISMGKFKQDPNLGGRGMAIAGLVTGYIGILISVLIIISIIFAANSDSSSFWEAFEQSLNEQQREQTITTDPPLSEE